MLGKLQAFRIGGLMKERVFEMKKKAKKKVQKKKSFQTQADKEMKVLNKVRERFDSLPAVAALEYLQELIDELKQSLRERHSGKK